MPHADKEKSRAYHAAYRVKNRARIRAAGHKWRIANPDRVRALARDYYRRHPEKALAKSRKRKYGLTAAEISDILKSQGDLCAICATPKPGGRGTWHLDHDHETGRARGLLCAACNQGLGRFEDNAKRLRAAANYLEKHKLL